MLWRIRADLGRERIGMMSLTIDTLRVAAPSSSAIPRAQMSGGKGAKGANLESLGNTGFARAGAKRRKPAQTGASTFPGPYSGAQVFLGPRIGPAPRRASGDWRIACGNCGNLHAAEWAALAEIAGITQDAVILGSTDRKPSLQASMPGAKEFPVAAVRIHAISCPISVGSTRFRRARPPATVLDRGRGRTYFAAPQKRP